MNILRKRTLTGRVQKNELVRCLAARMETDEKTAVAWLDAMLDTLYEAFKVSKSVTLPGFGGFYLRPGHESWAFKFNPGQKLRALCGWSSTYKGKP